MPFIAYRKKRWTAEHLQVVERANAIIAEFEAEGLDLTLRQIYYQFVARALIPNTKKSYKRLGDILNEARLNGLVDWEAIEDRVRWLSYWPTWDHPHGALKERAEEFRFDLWADQPERVEVWVEKDALVGVIAKACAEYRVPYFTCRGFVSQSEQWRAGQRFMYYNNIGQPTIVLHLGDHDPSGLDMTRDNIERLDMFSENSNVTVKRIALNMDQVERYNPPPNPAKSKDSRYRAYVKRFGRESWELDALNPRTLRILIERHIRNHVDADTWADALAREDEARAKLAKYVKRRWR